MARRTQKSRLIEVALPQTLAAADRLAVSSFLAGWPREDFDYRIGRHRARISLRSLDLRRFAHGIERLCADGAPAAAAQALKAILAAIERIGSYGVKGGRRIYAGYADERKVRRRKAKAAARAPYYYAVDGDFDAHNNPPPAAFLDRIICADSQKALKRFPENCIDLVFTSPPYNFGLEYARATHDAAHWRAYFEKLFAILDECVRVLKFGGRLVVNVQPLFSDYIPSHHIISNHLMSRKLIWKGEIIWEKNNYNCKYTAWGSWRSPSNPYLKYTWEFLEVFAKGTLKKRGDPAAADLTAEEFKKWVVSRWCIAPERNMRRYGHPAMFPEELAGRVIKLFSFRGDVVLDPFNGAGTTTLAAKKLGRHYVGIDVSPVYCRTARARLSAASLQG